MQIHLHPNVNTIVCATIYIVFFVKVWRITQSINHSIDHSINQSNPWRKVWFGLNKWCWLCLKSPQKYLNRTLFEGTAIYSGVRNHSGCYRVHSFYPIMHCNNECTTDVHSTAINTHNAMWGWGRMNSCVHHPEDGAHRWIIHPSIHFPNRIYIFTI